MAVVFLIVGVGVVFISLGNHVLTRVFSLTEPCFNNVAEYNALLIGLHLAQHMGVQYLEDYDDSKLIINQDKGEYEVHLKTSYLIIMQPFSWLIYSKASTSVIYPASKI